MAVGDDIQEGIAGVGEESAKAVGGAKGFEDLPGITDEKQTVVDEDALNQQFDPANDALEGLREGGEWLFNIIAEFFSNLFGNLG